MTGEEVRQAFEATLPQHEIERLCAPFGVIERQRKLHLGMLVRAMIISAETPGGAYQADVLRSYLECEVPKVACSALYRWFDEPLEHFMAALADRALTYPRAQQVDLSGILGGSKIGTSSILPPSGAAMLCARSSPAPASTRRSKCIKSSPSAVGRRYAPA
jgi:hypothetical protein